MTPDKRKPRPAATGNAANFEIQQGKNTSSRETVAMVFVSLLYAVLLLDSTLGMLEAQRVSALRMAKIASMQAEVSHVE